MFHLLVPSLLFPYVTQTLYILHVHVLAYMTFFNILGLDIISSSSRALGNHWVSRGDDGPGDGQKFGKSLLLYPVSATVTFHAIFNMTEVKPTSKATQF